MRPTITGVTHCHNKAGDQWFMPFRFTPTFSGTKLGRKQGTGAYTFFNSVVATWRCHGKLVFRHCNRLIAVFLYFAVKKVFQALNSRTKIEFSLCSADSSSTMSGCSTNWKRLTTTGLNKATLLHRRNTVHMRALWRCLRTCSYSGMWRRAVCKSTDVTQEGIASAFRVEVTLASKNISPETSLNVYQIHASQKTVSSIHSLTRDPIITTSINATPRL